MMSLKTFLQGAGLGAGLMYLWDPDRGKRRRAMLFDQWEHTVHMTQAYLDKAQRDLQNRVGGTQAAVGSRLRRDGAGDQVVRDRVRARLGRYVSHPHAVQVEAHDGQIVLSGQILADEVPRLVQAVSSVRGVRDVQNRLEVHEQAGNISALQGGIRPGGESWDMMQYNWAPGTRLLAQAAGLTLMGNCLVRKSLTSSVLGAAGFGLFLRGMTNRSMGELVGTSQCPETCGFQRTLHIHAPVEQVWEFLTDYDQVARFFPSISNVQRMGDDRVRWSVALPGGAQMECDEEIVRRVENERLEWRSTPDCPVSYHGAVNLQREGDGATRVNVHFTYAPPGGAVADALARVFGADPEHLFQSAALRAKSYLETGTPPHDVSVTAQSPSGQTT